MKLEIDSKHIWLDSQCVLCWIDSKKPLNTFVENRVNEIREQKDIKFHYIHTKENPADLASRGASTVELQGNRLWWKGPDWVTQSTIEWPVWNFNKEDESLVSETESELKKSRVMYEANLFAADGCSTENIEKNMPQHPGDIDISKFSSLTKLLRVTALVLKFIATLKKNKHENNTLEAADILNAEQKWIAYTQSEHFSDIIITIKENKPNNIKNQLGLYLDRHGLVRCGGRLKNAEICEGARHPLLLPKNSKLTDLIVENQHKRALHTGVAQTLGLVRHKYWIPHGRSVVKRALRQCAVCRRHEGGPYRMPFIPPLPYSRVSQAVPFTHTGIDYFGPLYIKTKTENQKVWVCLFTCLVTRAVHLELIQNMSAEQFILGFRRFLSRHGKPQEIISDNASQFKLASETLDKLWGQILTHDDVTSYIANEGITWKYIVEFAPWMGGFYERLVGLVKRTLRKAIGRSSLTNEQLLTVLKESEAVVNSRPLIYVGDDIQSHITLTPGHFLGLNPNIGIPNIDMDNDNEFNPNRNAADQLLQTWKKGLKLLERFWQIWRNDYLLSLRERSQSRLKETRVKSPYSAATGDIVLIKDDLPRGSWRVGRIAELLKSEDGEIRSARVTLPSNHLCILCINIIVVYMLSLCI